MCLFHQQTLLRTSVCAWHPCRALGFHGCLSRVSWRKGWEKVNSGTHPFIIHWHLNSEFIFPALPLRPQKPFLG